jgi:cell division control protein 7
LPYFPHTDFRIQYRTFLVADMRYYFRSLLTALHAVHKQNIIHRDIKPTSVLSHSYFVETVVLLILLSSNFLYNPERRRGVLVDFGLAEVSLSFIVLAILNFSAFSSL